MSKVFFDLKHFEIILGSLHVMVFEVFIPAIPEGFHFCFIIVTPLTHHAVHSYQINFEF